MADIIVIGGGAAGFFAAIEAASIGSNKVVILEKSSKTLTKVRVSGGGRCNVTHDCMEIPLMLTHYPRGSKLLRVAFNYFFTRDTIEWFERRGCKLKTESDGRMFPVTDNSQSVIDVLNREIEDKAIKIMLSSAVTSLQKNGNGFKVIVNSQNELYADKIIVAGGGVQNKDAYNWITALGHSITSTVPSLFTFNLPKEPINSLMGVSVPKSRVKITGSKLAQEGPLLITHWGMSGPVVLKTSAWGAKLLNEKLYDFKFLVSWNADFTIEGLTNELIEVKHNNARKKIVNDQPEGIPKRLWEYLLERSGIMPDQLWAELSKKQLNALVNCLAADEYNAKGKTTFKEEFVTCGGVDLSEIDFKTMESKIVPGLYFAGEVLDIDGVTGGFNFQAAWTTGFLAGTYAGGRKA